MSYGLLGFACDEGVRRNNGRVGAVFGPAAFREALQKIQFHPSSPLPFTDFGDVVCDDQDLESAQQRLAQKVSEILSQNHISVVVGGGHETAWGHFQGIAKAFPDETIGIINFDAHFDLRPVLEGGLGTSGSPFKQIADHYSPFNYMVLGVQPFSNSDALFETAKKLNVSYVTAENFDAEAGIAIQNFLNAHKRIYLSICLDVFAEFAAPGVSAPQALGLLPLQILAPLRQIKQSNQLIAFDIVELAPLYDRQNTTAKLAASLFGHIVSH